jgi:hypothetical protein
MSDLEVLQKINLEILNAIQRSKERLYKIREQLTDDDVHSAELRQLLSDQKTSQPHR